MNTKNTVPLKRPWQTLYFTSTCEADDQAVAHGHAATEAGAIRASVVRVFLNQYREARVYDAGVLVYTIRHNKAGLQIYFGRAPSKESK